VSKVKKITVGENGFIPLEAFKDFVDTTKVISYKFTATPTGVKLAFYGKNGKKLPLLGKELTKKSIDK
jgi:hypothetical protein